LAEMSAEGVVLVEDNQVVEELVVAYIKIF
jgi:hypothetical protein